MKSTESRAPVCPAAGVPSTGPPSLAQRVQSQRHSVREALVQQIREAVRRTAVQLVEDEIHELVGEPWSRKAGTSALTEEAFS